MRRPPRWAEWLLGALLPREDRDEILGDLAESYRARARERPASAAAWYGAQMILVPLWVGGSAVRAMRWDAGEVRRTARRLTRAPGFTAMAVCSLGLGIGATTAIAGAMQALLYNPLPVDQPRQLALVYHTWPEEWEGGQYGSSSGVDPTDGADVASNVSFPAWTELQRATPADVGLAAYAFIHELGVVAGDAPALAASGMLVSGNFMSTVGVQAEVGRVLVPSDDRGGASPVAMLSHSYWQRAFGGDPSIVGRTVRLNGDPYEIVGVTQRGFVGLSPGGFFRESEVVVPLAASERFVTAGLADGETLTTATLTHWVRLIARVPDQVDRTAVAREWTAVLSEHMVEAGVIAAGVRDELQVRALEGWRGLDSLREDTRGPLQILAAVVALVLLIACANLTTLLLARAATRREELAVRRAMGASRWELAFPQLLESGMLAALGGALGLWIALEGGPVLVASLTGGDGAAAVEYRMSWGLILMATTSALAAALLSGVLPALRQARADPGDHLGPRSQGGSIGRFGLGRVLIAAQIAISVPLVVGAGLFLRTLDNVGAIDVGFDPEQLLVFRVDASLVTDDPDREYAIYRRILDDLEAAPGVRSAAIVENVLVSGWMSNTSVQIEGLEERRMMDMNAMSPGFFETMGVRLRSGRLLSESDHADTAPVVLVNETAERTLFGGSAVGKSFQIGRSRTVEIVGVVADTKYSSLKDEASPAFYDPWTQRPQLWTVNYVVRLAAPDGDMEPVIRRIVSDADPGLPISTFRSQGDEIEAQILRERVFARLLTAFGGFALLLSCIGLYGLMSFSVAQRNAEMGVRLALGAAPLSIVSMVLSQVMRLTAIGLALGLVLALQVGPSVRALLFGVEPDDATTLFTAVVAMSLVAVVAGAIPAFRASRVDPLRSLAP